MTRSRRLSSPEDGQTPVLLEALDDEFLLQNIAAGDEAAFECLYRRYYRRLLRFLLRLTQQPELAEEVLSETLMTVWEKAPSFAGRSSVSTWITGIAYHKAIKRLAQFHRHHARHANDSDLAQFTDPDLLETTLVAEDTGKHLRQALLTLPPAHRAVVELAYFHGYSYPEIAMLTNCPVNTVKTRMFHARAKLRTAIESLGLETDSAI